MNPKAYREFEYAIKARKIQSIRLNELIDSHLTEVEGYSETWLIAELLYALRDFNPEDLV